MYEKILVPVDGSPTASRGLDEAIKLARLTGASLRLLNVVDLWSLAMSADASMGGGPDVLTLLREGGQAILADAKAHVEAAGVRADAVLSDSLAGRVSEVIVDQATSWGADLIVIGTHGRRGVGRLVLGSDAEQVARMAPVPVLLVRARVQARTAG